MLIIRAGDLAGSGREQPFGPDARALTYLTSSEGAGFGVGVVASASDVVTEAMTYRHHVKMNYVLEGSGTITNVESRRAMAPGSGVLLLRGDRTTVTAWS